VIDMSCERDTCVVPGTDLRYPFWIQAYIPKDDHRERLFLGWIDGIMTIPDDGGDGGAGMFGLDNFGRFQDESPDQGHFDEACMNLRDSLMSDGILLKIGDGGRIERSFGFVTCGRGVIRDDYATSPITPLEEGVAR